MGKKGVFPENIRPAIITCPQCRGKAIWQNNPHRPFCSERCRLIDLGCWVEEAYRMAGEAVESDPADASYDDNKSF